MMAAHASGSDRTGIWRVLTWPVGPMVVVGRYALTAPPPRAAEIIEHSSLPPELKRLVAEVVGRTHLWHGEQADVARELVSHFGEAMAVGGSADGAREAFGDPVRAARLIARSKRRGRPLAWFALIRALQLGALLALLLILTYITLVIRFYSASPVISQDYVAWLDAPAKAVPEEHRAWPVYREAFLAIGAVPDALNKQISPGRRALPGDAGWSEIQEFVRGHTDVLAQVRSAAARPALGYLQGDGPDGEVYTASLIQHGMDREKARESAQRHVQYHASADRPLVFHLFDTYVLRQLFRMLIADAHDAAGRGDSARVAADLRVAIGMASHLRQFPMTVGDQMGLSMFLTTSRTVGEIIEHHPELLSEEDLTALAHGLGAFGGGGRLRTNLEGERATVMDTIQRTFTDDGAGDGRLAAGGIEFLMMLTSAENRSDPLSLMLKNDSAHPVLGAIVAGRAETVARAERLFDQLEAAIARPAWERDDLPDLEFDDADRLRFPVLAATMSGVGRLIDRAEYATVQRDAALVAIALELHRRRHDSYPRSLAELEPMLLPRVPLDPFDGLPMKYAFSSESRPLVYVVGADRRDNGGRPPPEGVLDRENRRFGGPHRLRSLSQDEGNAVEGDWVLWTRGE